MSQQQDPDIQREEESDKAEPKRSTKPFDKLGVSPAQVTGTGLAAATAAVLGGQLGIAGTVSGAALTSVVITLGGAVYQRSLESTRERAANAALRRAARRRTTQAADASGWVDPHAPTKPIEHRPNAGTANAGTGSSGKDVAGGSPATERPDAEPTRRLVVPDATRRIRPVGDGDSSREPTTVIGGATGGGSAGNGNTVVNRAGAAGEGESPGGKRRGFNWRVVALTSGLAFVLCMVLITGYESITGDSVSGDSGGTTVGSMFRPGGAGARTEPSETGERVPASESSSTPEPSESAEFSEPSDTSTAPSETSTPEESAERQPSSTGDSTSTNESETSETSETGSAESTPDARLRQTARPSAPGE
ncbi:hypothetical protein SAMN04487820_108166 [Actinopolyspora mzabensis]|uniref:Uncharacterized protein n=1 Tax=Actinopolyspora mzabensis TaxID=995066 RepID=A0A1G9C7M0_ACTMZ|nr:hypothetical protein [Actinopolyspora mzabensis]SDK47656.1 hypothetical protein SAMN04487820_108166 [Actinopolyspora mzabensis]